MLLDFLTLFIHSFLPSISVSSSEKIKNTLVYKTFFKGDQFSSKDKFYILKSGIIKSTAKKTNDNIYTINFFISGSKSNKITNIINLPKTKNNFNCLTDIELYECDYNKVEFLINNDLEISNLLNKIFEHKIIINENKIDSFIKLETKERYLILIEEFPYLEKIIPKYEIAAYLNISPIQLARIRKKYRKANFINIC